MKARWGINGIGLLLLLLGQQVFSAPLILQDQNSYDLSPYLSFFEDSRAELNFAQVLKHKETMIFQKNTDHLLSFAFSDSAYWIYFSIHNQQSIIPWFLTLDYAYLEEIDLYIKSDDGEWKHRQGGIQMHFYARELSYQTFIFPLILDVSSSTEVYMRFKTRGPLLVPLSLQSNKAQLKRSSDATLLHGMFFGMLMAIVIYNLFLFFSIRDRMYLYYIAYVVLLGMFNLNFEGFSFRYFWPDWIEFNILATPLSANISMVFLILFTRRILDTSHHYQRIDRLLKIWAISLIFFAIIMSLFMTHITFMLLTIFIMASALAIFAIGFSLLLKQYRPSYYFMTAFTFLLLGIMVLDLMLLGYLPNNDFTRYALQYGSVLEVMLLSFALADRINTLEKDRNKAQELAMESQRILNDELESQVNERTKDLERLNTELQYRNEVDGLTEIYNRTFFDSQLAYEWQSHLLQQTSLAVVMMDIDFFKHYNDAYGYVQGDACIKRIATLLRANLNQRHDWVCRYGGAEFVVILPQTSARVALEVAKRLQAKLADEAIAHKASDVSDYVTFSIGISIMTPQPRMKSLDFFDQVIEALRESKNKGRNSITLHPLAE